MECCDQAEKAEDLIFLLKMIIYLKKIVLMKCLQHIQEFLLFLIMRYYIMSHQIIVSIMISFTKHHLLVGKEFRWRIVNETLLTFMFI